MTNTHVHVNTHTHTHTHTHTYGAVEFSTQDPRKDTISRYNIVDSYSWHRNKEGGTWVSGSSLKKCFIYYDHILSMKNKYIYFSVSNNITQILQILYLTNWAQISKV